MNQIKSALKMASLGGVLIGGSLLFAPTAQAASVRACLPSETLASFITKGACQAPDGNGTPGASDKIFTINSALTSSATNWRDGSITITTDIIGDTDKSSDQLYRLGYTRTKILPWSDNNNQFTLAYTIEIAPASIKYFEFSSVNFNIFAARTGIKSTSKIWTDGFNGSSPLPGTPLSITNSGSSPTVPIASTSFPTINKLYVLDTIQRTKTTSPTGEITSFTNEFGQREIPEPSMIFGILVVAGVGVVSRFRGK